MARVMGKLISGRRATKIICASKIKLCVDQSYFFCFSSLPPAEDYYFALTQKTNKKIFLIKILHFYNICNKKNFFFYTNYN